MNTLAIELTADEIQALTDGLSVTIKASTRELGWIELLVSPPEIASRRRLHTS